MVNNFGWVHDVLEAAVCQDGMLGKIIPAAVSHSLNSFCGMASNLLLILAHEAQISRSVDKWRSRYLVKLLTVVNSCGSSSSPWSCLPSLLRKTFFTTRTKPASCIPLHGQGKFVGPTIHDEEAQFGIEPLVR